MLRFYYNLWSEVVNHVYLLSLPEDSVVSMHIWHRLTQKGLNVQHCSELTVSDGVVKSEVIVALLTEDFQENPDCVLEMKHARELIPSRRVISVFLESDGDIWMNEDMYYYCKMRDTTTVSFDISRLVSDPSWKTEEGPSSCLLNEMNIELDRLIVCINDNINKM